MTKFQHKAAGTELTPIYTIISEDQFSHS